MFWRTRPEKDSSNPWERVQRRKRRGSLAFFLLSLIPATAILAVISWRPVLRAYGNWLSATSFTDRADLAVVLDSSTHKVEAAVQLFYQNKVNGIFVNALSKESFEQLVKQYELPPTQVYWGGCRATTTYAEPYYFLQAYEHYDIGELESIVIISDKYHLRRAKWSYSAVLNSKRMHPQIQTYAAPNESLRIRKGIDWWQSSYYKDWVREETQKYIFYLINYGILNRENVDIVSSNPFRRVDPEELIAYKKRKEATCGEHNPNDPLDKVPVQKR